MTKDVLYKSLTLHDDKDIEGQELEECMVLLNSRPAYVYEGRFKELERKTVNHLKLSIEQPANLELKQLPSHLKYAFLKLSSHLLVIISTGLIEEMEEKLLIILQAHKKAIGWTIADIHRISPIVCTHKILMDNRF